MTTAETTPSNADVPVLGGHTMESDSAATASEADRRRDGGGRHRRYVRRQAIENREISLDRWVRLRLLAGSLIGAGCLVLAYRLQPGEGAPFAAPPGPVAWVAMIAGIAGIWLVPGLWMSAVMMRTGAGPVARLATRIGTTLAWYALAGPVIHVCAQGALVTNGGIVGATVAATAAVCLGVALGLLRRPASPTLRVLMAALAGAICAQTVILLSMFFFTYGINYQHIRRLDWLIVLACALLTAIGAHSRPDLPLVRTARHGRPILVSLAVVAITAIALVATGSRWSPAQRMPSAIGAEQVAAPPGADIAVALSAIGPEAPGLMQRAAFTAFDDTGRPVPVITQLVQTDGSAHQATLLVMLDRSSQSVLCGTPDFTGHLGRVLGAEGLSVARRPVKLTLREPATGVLVQALVPADWCAL